MKSITKRKGVPSRVDRKGENGHRSPLTRCRGEGGRVDMVKREGEGREGERVREVMRSGWMEESNEVEEEAETGEQSIEGRERERDRTEVRGDADKMQQEQPRAPGSRPNPVPALLAALLASMPPSVKWGGDPHSIHSPLLLCWSGGEAAGKERRPKDGAGLTHGTCPGLGAQGTPASHSLSRALAPWHIPDRPPTAKASLSVTSCLECPPSPYLVPC